MATDDGPVVRGGLLRGEALRLRRRSTPTREGIAADLGWPAPKDSRLAAVAGPPVTADTDEADLAGALSPSSAPIAAPVVLLAVIAAWIKVMLKPALASWLMPLWAAAAIAITAATAKGIWQRRARRHRQEPGLAPCGETRAEYLPRMFPAAGPVPAPSSATGGSPSAVKHKSWRLVVESSSSSTAKKRAVRFDQAREQEP